LGRALQARDIQPVHVLYKRFADWEHHCLLCHDGGEVLMCTTCPRVMHPHCAGVKGSIGGQWKCGQHRCHECDRNAHDAGGMLFRCTRSANTHCDVTAFSTAEEVSLALAQAVAHVQALRLCYVVFCCT
jgi:hypothetical protein